MRVYKNNTPKGLTVEFYKRLTEGKLTPEEDDYIRKKWKVGKYREWEFDLERFHEIADRVTNDYEDRAYTAAIAHVRKNYPDLNHLSDKEILKEGHYKLFWKDHAHVRTAAKARNKQNRQNSKIDDFE